MPRIMAHLACIAISMLLLGCGVDRPAGFFERDEGLQRQLKPGESMTCAVQTTGGWQATGVILRAGERIRIAVSGTASCTPYWPPVTPAGVNYGPARVCPQWLHGAVIARMTRSGQPFYVGTGVDYTAEQDGPLYMRINDTRTSDNSGAFSATISLLDSGGGVPVAPAAIVSCDLRIIRLSDGSVLAEATGKGSVEKLAALSKEMAGKLQEGILVKGESIAVVTFRNRSGTNQGRTLTDELTDKLAGALVKSDWFDVKERIDLRVILREQELDTAGIVKNPDVQRKLAGVKYIVIGGVTVTEPTK